MSQGLKMKVNPKLKTVTTFAMAALALTLIALGSGKVNKNGIEVSQLAALGGVIPVHTPLRIQEEQRKQNLQAAYARNELYRQLNSGTRSEEEIQKELTDAIGNGEAIPFVKGAFDRAYKLSMVMTHFKNEEATPYEILFIHNFRINDLAEDGVTLYTRNISGVEESTTSNLLVIPKALELDENSEPILNPNNQMTYIFQLEGHSNKPPFYLRDPEAVGGFREPAKTDYSPLALLNRPDTFENGTYSEQIMVADGRIINTEVTLRRTDIGTLTVTVKAQEVGTKVTQTSVLVYEEL